MAMIKADICEPTIEPSLMRVKESTPAHYVPEVFCKFKNEYEVFVQSSAKPTFPVDYLLVKVPLFYSRYQTQLTFMLHVPDSRLHSVHSG